MVSVSNKALKLSSKLSRVLRLIMTLVFVIVEFTSPSSKGWLTILQEYSRSIMFPQPLDPSTSSKVP